MALQSLSALRPGVAEWLAATSATKLISCSRKKWLPPFLPHLRFLRTKGEYLASITRSLEISGDASLHRWTSVIVALVVSAGTRRRPARNLRGRSAAANVQTTFQISTTPPTFCDHTSCRSTYRSLKCALCPGSPLCLLLGWRPFCVKEQPFV